ncbi:MAG: DUF5320 domain-containing protein [Armatimonadetes bacterium]|nr:DUF5320 domain-containing protein [Armatimonadota bacterium]
MPGFNGTGPFGSGPMTGRGYGYCISRIEPAAGFGPGAGRGRGICAGNMGRPRRARLHRRALRAEACFVPPVSGEQELEALREQVAGLENELARAKMRIQELQEKQ